jgi:hypothetical protein
MRLEALCWVSFLNTTRPEKIPTATSLSSLGENRTDSEGSRSLRSDTMLSPATFQMNALLLRGREQLSV